MLFGALFLSNSFNQRFSERYENKNFTYPNSPKAVLLKYCQRVLEIQLLRNQQIFFAFVMFVLRIKKMVENSYDFW